MSGLRECPFCKSTDTAVEHLGDDERPFFIVTCRACQADGPVMWDVNSAVEAWNTRRTHDGDGQS